MSWLLSTFIQFQILETQLQGLGWACMWSTIYKRGGLQTHLYFYCILRLNVIFSYYLTIHYILFLCPLSCFGVISSQNHYFDGIDKNTQREKLWHLCRFSYQSVKWHPPWCSVLRNKISLSTNSTTFVYFFLLITKKNVNVILCYRAWSAFFSPLPAAAAHYIYIIFTHLKMGKDRNKADKLCMTQRIVQTARFPYHMFYNPIVQLRS